MESSQTVTEAMVLELAENSFKTFCDDISGMFGIDIQCNPQQVTAETIEGLKIRFKDLVALYPVNAEGALDGTFHLVFDQQGLFILAGIVAMQPEQMILENVKSGSLEKAQKENNILKEVGAALVGSWDRVCRKGLDGHGRFEQKDIFIGNPWGNPQESIGLAANEQVTLVPYEMTVGPFPPFNCAIIFNNAFLARTPRPDTQQPASDEEKAREEGEDKTQAETENKAPNISEATQEIAEVVQEETAEATKSDESASAKQAKRADEETAAEQTKPEENTKEATEHEKNPAANEQSKPADEETVTPDESTSVQEPEAAAEQKPDDLEQQPATTDEADNNQDRPISDAIKKMTQSSAVSSDESTPAATAEKPALNSKDTPLAVCAKDIMQKNVIWANPNDSVQQALAKIQQNDAGYIMIGRGQILEGIVSKSDLTGALSPYLRSIFAKWHRPLDDATLQIRLKWIMAKPTNTIQPETPLSTIMETMCQAGLRCLPVADEQSKVLGLVTVFDIFKAFLNQSSHT